MDIKTQTTQEKLINSKGLYFEVLFNDLWKYSEKFKRYFLKEISKKLNIKFQKESSKILDWKNKDKESFKPFDFELDIKNQKFNYKFLIDIKYRTERKDAQLKLTQVAINTINKIDEECVSKQIKCFYIIVIWSPNFFNLHFRKSNFILMDIVSSSHNINLKSNKI